LHLLILLISPAQLGFRPNTRKEPCKRKVLLLHLFTVPLLVVAMVAPLAVPGQDPCLQNVLQNVQLGLTLVVPIGAQVVSLPPRLLFFPLNHPLLGAILQQFLLL
jgi:hypothetical protein